MRDIVKRIRLEDTEDQVERNGGTERDSRGRFLQGNPGGPGNPLNKAVHRLRAALIRAVSEDDLEAVIGTLLRQAKDGDVPSAKVLLERLFGKPYQELLLSVDNSQFVPDERFL